MVDIGASCFETLDSGSGLLADDAIQHEAMLQGRVQIYQCSIHRLVYILGPQRAVKMHPLVHVEIQ